MDVRRLTSTHLRCFTSKPRNPVTTLPLRGEIVARSPRSVSAGVWCLQPRFGRLQRPQGGWLGDLGGCKEDLGGESHGLTSAREGCGTVGAHSTFGPLALGLAVGLPGPEEYRCRSIPVDHPSTLSKIGWCSAETWCSMVSAGYSLAGVWCTEMRKLVSSFCDQHPRRSGGGSRNGPPREARARRLVSIHSTAHCLRSRFGWSRALGERWLRPPYLCPWPTTPNPPRL